MQKLVETSMQVVLLLFMLTAALGVQSCQFPNVSPFVRASGDLRASVVLSADAVANEIRLPKMSLRGEQKGTLQVVQQLLETEEKKLRGAWMERVRALDGVVRYAESLQAIVSSGQEAEKNVRDVVDAVKGLAAAANIPVPGAGSIAVAGLEIGQLVSAAIIQIQAARSLAQATRLAQTAIDAIASKIVEDIKDLKPLLLDVVTLQRNALQIGFEAELETRNRILMHRLEVFEKSLATVSAGEVKRVTELVAAMDDWYKPYEAELARIDERERRVFAVLAELTQGVLAWADTHRNLAHTLQSRLPLDSAAVSNAVVRIRTVVNDLREH